MIKEQQQHSTTWKRIAPGHYVSDNGFEIDRTTNDYGDGCRFTSWKITWPGRPYPDEQAGTYREAKELVEYAIAQGQF